MAPPPRARERERQITSQIFLQQKEILHPALSPPHTPCSLARSLARGDLPKGAFRFILVLHRKKVKEDEARREKEKRPELLG